MIGMGISGVNMTYDKLWSEAAKHMKSSIIRELLKWAVEKDIISFGGGMPDPKNIPKKELAEITYKLILEKGERVLIYGPTKGSEYLRETLQKFVERHDMKIKSIEEIAIVTGSQQALDLFGRVLLDKGNYIIVEKPTYLAAINAFHFYEPRMVGIPLDENGMKMEKLEEEVKRLKKEGKKIKFIYTIPTCQNPSGYSMSVDRRKELLEIASKYDLFIIEDDPYSYFLYEPIKVRYIKAMDTENRVIFTSTFSKILSPGLRVGWMIGDEEMINKLCVAKQSMDLCTSPLNQYIAAAVSYTHLTLPTICSV